MRQVKVDERERHRESEWIYRDMESWENSLQISGLSPRFIWYYSSFHFVFVFVLVHGMAWHALHSSLWPKWRYRVKEKILCCNFCLSFYVTSVIHWAKWISALLQYRCCALGQNTVVVLFTLNFPTSAAITERKLSRNHIQHRLSMHACMNALMNRGELRETGRQNKAYIEILIRCCAYSLFVNDWLIQRLNLVCTTTLIREL